VTNNALHFLKQEDRHINNYRSTDNTLYCVVVLL